MKLSTDTTVGQVGSLSVGAKPPTAICKCYPSLALGGSWTKKKHFKLNEWTFKTLKSVSHFYWGAVNVQNQNVPLKYAHTERLEGHVVQAVAVLAAPINQVKVQYNLYNLHTHHSQPHNTPCTSKMYSTLPPHTRTYKRLPLFFTYLDNRSMSLGQSTRWWCHRWWQLWWTVNWRGWRENKNWSNHLWQWSTWTSE